MAVTINANMKRKIPLGMFFDSFQEAKDFCCQVDISNEEILCFDNHNFIPLEVVVRVVSALQKSEAMWEKRARQQSAIIGRRTL